MFNLIKAITVLTTGLKTIFSIIIKIDTNEAITNR